MEISNTIDSVVIVGGGTAGWLTASKLAKKLNSNKEGAISVTLIESPDIPTVGVGEGTWPTICLLYTSPSPRDRQKSRMPSSA